MLLVPVGLAGLVVVAELFAWQELTGELTPIALLVVGIAGYALGYRRLRGATLDPWPLAAGVGAYLALCAPVIFSGEPTLAGYLLDTTVGFHLLGSDYLLEHGRDFSELPASSYRITLEGYFGTQYPSGGHTLLGGAGRLVGLERIWLYQPFLSVVVACCAPTLYFLARRATLPAPIAAGGALLATIPALVYSYAEMGAIKELTALPFILLLGAILVLLPRLLGLGLRAALVPAVVVAAGVGAIGFAFLPWFGLVALAGLVLLLRDADDRRRVVKPLLTWAAVLGAALVILALPTFGPLSESLRLAESFSTSNQAAVNDPGNLLQPLKPAQMVGVWLNGSHRTNPTGWIEETYLLIGVSLVAIVLGCLFLVRRRLWPLVAWVVVSGIVWALLTRRGTAWTDAKLLVITSPVVVLLGAVGVESLRRAGRHIEAAVVGLAIVVGILGSNAFTYHDTNILPTERYEELLDINERFASDKPALVPEFDELALYALQDLPPDGPGFSFKTEPIARLADGTFPSYGLSYDVDQLAPGAVLGYDTIVVRRRPDASRPPAAFEHAFRGRFYDVWKRRAGVEVVAHMPAGSGLQAAGRVDCASVRSAVEDAGPGAEVSYVPRPRLLTIDPVEARRSPGWLETIGGVGLYAPGELREVFRAPAGGRYRVWLKGEFGRELSVYVNGERAGGVSYESGNDGNYGTPIEATLNVGINRLLVRRGGGSLRPGDGSPGALRAIVLEPVHVDTEPRTVPAGDWREACERPVDWVEVVRPA